MKLINFTILSSSLDFQERHIRKCMTQNALFRDRAKFHCRVLCGCVVKHKTRDCKVFTHALSLITCHAKLALQAVSTCHADLLVEIVDFSNGVITF